MKPHTVPHAPGAPAQMLRPSSARRLANLRRLVAEFVARDIGHTGVALFLGCSLSAARNYVAQLIDAGVVCAHPVRQAAGCIDRRLYKLKVDPLAVHAYLAELARSHGVEMRDWEDAAADAPVLDAGRIRHGWSAADSYPGAPPRRDPLVAALFGAARPV